MDALAGERREGDEIVVGRQAQDEALGAEAQVEQRPERVRGRQHRRSWWLGVTGCGAAACGSGSRRYTPGMGAVGMMEVFFEKLNAGDREGAVALMDST
ncbi:MAG: hypothetical protein M5U34_07280 [Chloroflexi bacterium]|nr:hypothetical protein [Chloroflexota bacterium]